MNKKIKVFTLVMALMLIISSVAFAADNTSLYNWRYGHNTLKRGHTGEYVRNLQEDINSTRGQTKAYCGAADGIFGKNTYDGVCQYQKKRGLTQDGQAGNKTKTKLIGEVWHMYP